MTDIIIEKNGPFNVWQVGGPRGVDRIFIASYKTRAAAERTIERRRG